MAISDPSSRLGAEQELGEYRSVSRLAIGSLGVAAFSPLAWLHPLLWPVAWVTVGLAALTLVRLRTRPELIGRGLAQGAMVIGLFSAAGAPARMLAYQHLLTVESEQFVQGWVKLLQDGQPQMAHQLKMFPSARQTANVNLWNWYRKEPEKSADLRQYVNQPVQRSLLGLGRQAQVRRYDTLSVEQVGNEDLVCDRWVVTFEDPGAGRRSYFFVTVTSRRYDPKSGIGRWKLDTVVPVSGLEMQGLESIEAAPPTE
ncbi:MAG: hypothetical protein K1X74_00255 [Pirellulales bacterium]|nr:hypothetical protein [Pirellulales bacterium]